MNLIKRITDKLRRKPLLVKPVVMGSALKNEDCYPPTIEYKGYKYWYEYKLAKNRKDICLATNDPEKYCNGFFIYSDKDSGTGKEYVVIGTNNPDPNWMES